jgi:effector-binding domain-containing protein
VLIEPEEIAMSRAIPVLLVLVLTLTSAAHAEDPVPLQVDGRPFLRGVVESMGGDAALAAIKGMRIAYKGTYGGMPYKSEIIWVAPARLVFKLDASVFTGSTGTDGDMAWTAFQCPPARAKGALARSMKEWRDHYEILLVRPLLHRKGLIIADGGMSIHGVVTRKIHVTFPDGRKTVLSFMHDDDGKWYLAYAEGEATQMDGRRGSFRWHLSAPTSFGGVRMPTKFAVKTFVDGQLTEDMVEEIVSIEWNPKVTDATFAVPKLDVPLMKPVLKDVPEVRGLATMHAGSYDGTGKTIDMLSEIVKKRGLHQTGPVHLVFLNNPKNVADVAELRTRIILPCSMHEAPADLPKGVTVHSRPAGKYASIFARGPYGKADVEALVALFAWMTKTAMTPAGPPAVLCSHDPKVIVAEDLLSEVLILVK